MDKKQFTWKLGGPKEGKGKKKSSEKILLGLLLIFTCYPILTRSGVFKILFKNKIK